MGINYNYDIDTVGGGWYLYELDFPPSYIAPLKPERGNGEDEEAWGIFDERGRMSNFRIHLYHWSPTYHGFVDGYIIDNTHDKYFSNLDYKPEIGNRKYLIPGDHRWPCFCMDLQVVVAVSMMVDIVSHAVFVKGDNKEYIDMGNTEYLYNLGFRFNLPDISFCIDYMKNNDIPREHYKDIAYRLRESRDKKKSLGITYGTLGWQDASGEILQYNQRQTSRGPIGEMLDKYVAAIDEKIKNGHYDLQCEDLFGAFHSHSTK